MPKKPTKLEALKWMVTSLPQIASKPELRGAFETTLATLWAKEEGTLQNIIRDFRTPDELEREIDDRVIKSLVMFCRYPSSWPVAVSRSRLLRWATAICFVISISMLSMTGLG